MRNAHFAQPTESQRLLLLACLSPESKFEQRLRNWEAAQELNSIDAGSLRLLPFLSHRIETMKMPARDRGRIKGVYLKNWFEQQASQVEVQEVLSVLQDRGLHPIVLKGYALIQVAYPGAAPTRPSADLDLLVDSPTLNSAVALFTNLGYQAPLAYSPLDHNAGLKSMGLRHPGKLLEIDVHVRILNFGADPEFSNRIRERAVTMQLAGTQVLTLCPTDHLLHILIHGSGVNEVPPIRWIVDAAQLISNCDIDWALFATEVAHNKLRVPILAQLQYLVSEFDIPVPSAVIETIKASPQSLSGLLMSVRAQMQSRNQMRIARVLFGEYLARPETYHRQHFWLWYPLANPLIAWQVVRDFKNRRQRIKQATSLARSPH